MTRPVRAISRKNPAKRWVTLAALLAFFLQGLALQTHIHPLSEPLRVTAPATASTPAPAPLKNQDPVDQCRLCQELVHAGTYVAPAATPALVSLAQAVAVFTRTPSVTAQVPPAFGWQSRGPPAR